MTLRATTRDRTSIRRVLQMVPPSVIAMVFALLLMRYQVPVFRRVREPWPAYDPALRPEPDGALAGEPPAGRQGRRLSATAAAPAAVLLLPVLAALLLVYVVVSEDVHLFRPSWVLHPDETGMLFSSKHLAESGSLTVDDDWYQQSAAHVPEGVTSARGRLVPQKALLGYVLYAGAFLVSDDAWQYVTPFFGLASAAAIGWLVYRRTRNRGAGLAAAVAFATCSPMIMYASGLAFVDVIATAFYLGGVVALYEHTRSGSRRLLLAAGIAFAAAMLTRYDFFIAGVVAIVVIGWLQRRRPLLANAAGTLPLAIPLALALAGTCLANWWLYGSPFTTGYQAGSWQTSPGGVATSLYDFSAIEFGRLAWSYLFQIGLSCTLLLGFGLAAKAWLRSWDPADALVVTFAGFGIVYYLGKEGAYGSSEAWLVASYPRYLLPAYAAGVIVGVDGIANIIRPFRWSKAPLAGVLAAVALLAAAIGLHEAWSNDRGVPYTERVISVHSVIRDVTRHTPYPVLVSDVSSKAVTDSYTITPRRLAGPDEIVKYVERDLRAKRHVLLTDESGHPLYTGFVETLEAAGYRLTRRRRNPAVFEVNNSHLTEDTTGTEEGGQQP